MNNYIKKLKAENEMTLSIDKANLENSFWITDTPFSPMQLESTDYAVSISPGFIFLKNDFVLIVSVSWSAILLENCIDIDLTITDFDGFYKSQKLSNGHIKVAVYELWFENERLKVKYSSECDSAAKTYFFRKIIFDESKIHERLD